MTNLLPSQPLQQYQIQLESGGCLILPLSLQQQLNLKEGDRFILIVEADKSLRLVSLPEQVQKLQGLFKDIAPGISLADELIEDRRQEARRESES